MVGLTLFDSESVGVETLGFGKNYDFLFK